MAMKVTYVGHVLQTTSPEWTTMLQAAALDLSGAPGTSTFAFAVPTEDPKAFKVGWCELSSDALVYLIQHAMATDFEKQGSRLPGLQLNGKYDCATAQAMAYYAAYIRGEEVKNDAWIAGPEDIMVLLSRSVDFNNEVQKAMGNTTYKWEATALVVRGAAKITPPTGLGTCGFKSLGNGITTPPPAGFTPPGLTPVGLGDESGESSWMTYAGIAAAAGAAGLAVWALRSRARKG